MTELHEGEHVREYPNGWVVLSGEFLVAMCFYGQSKKGKA